MFLTPEDYKVVIGTTALNVTTQTDNENRERAEAEAIEEISGYLRPKYDTDAIFTAEGKNRNPHMVMITCDVALYHLTSSTPQKMGMEIRKERYDRAIQWLEDVQSGKVVPNLPHKVDEQGNSATPIYCGSNRPLKHVW